MLEGDPKWAAQKAIERAAVRALPNRASSARDLCVLVHARARPIATGTTTKAINIGAHSLRKALQPSDMSETGEQGADWPPVSPAAGPITITAFQKNAPAFGPGGPHSRVTVRRRSDAT